MRGFWEDTWLSRHSAGATSDLRHSDRYLRSRALETHCMQAADLVVTLGEAMRDEIVERGIDPANILIVPNGVSQEFLRPLPDPAALKSQLGIKTANTSSASSPAWSRTRASARCSRP